MICKHILWYIISTLFTLAEYIQAMKENVKPDRSWLGANSAAQWLRQCQKRPSQNELIALYSTLNKDGKHKAVLLY